MASPSSSHSSGLQRFLSIGTKLSVSAIVLVLLVAVVVFFSLTRRERDALLTAEQRAGQMVTDLVVGAAVAPLEFEDPDVMQEELERLRRNDAVNYAGVWRLGEDGLTPLADYRATGFEDEVPTPAKVEAALVDSSSADELVFPAPVYSIEAGDHELGIVQVRLSLAKQNAAFAASRRWILAASVAVGAALLILLLAFVRRIVVRPLAELSAAAQRVEQGEHAQVEITAHDEVGELALAFNRMGEAIAEREQRIARTNRQLQRLLDNMQQAIFSFGPDMKIRSNHSKAALDVFRRAKVEGIDVCEELLAGYGPESHEAEAVRVWFDSVFELGADLWPELLELAPTELTIRSDTDHATDLEFVFRPVIDEGELREVIVLATDTTERNQAERQAREWETKYAREMSAMQKIVSGGTQIFVQFLRSTEERLARIKVLLTRSDKLLRGELEELFRHAHTIKGEARTFDLVDLQRSATRLEDQLGRLRRWLDEERPINWEGMLSETLMMLGAVKQAFEGTRDLLVQASPMGTAILEQTTVFQSDLDELLTLIAAKGDKPNEPLPAALIAVAERLGSRPFAEIGMRLVEAVPTWADAEGKRARLEIYGGETRVPAKLIEALPSALTHLVRNAVAHGIEMPAARKDAGKAEVGVISLRCKAHDKGVEITVEDDGRGLDDEAIFAQAKARGLGSVGASLTNLIFVPGLSTSTSTSDLSGRGVGLQCVRNDLAELGYRTTVDSKPGQGCRFTLSPVPER